MTIPCSCSEPHPERRIVLTGGPGAGKTAILELVRQSFCAHVQVLPEAAGILFGGGFPRGPGLALRRAAQRAIYFTQRELEATSAGKVSLCDRGTVDGSAYWPGPDNFWAGVGTTREAQLLRYDAVVHLRTPTSERGYNHANPLRIETAAEAAEIDAGIFAAWDGHPRRHVVDAMPDFFAKARRALELLRGELPPCCRQGASPA